MSLRISSLLPYFSRKANEVKQNPELIKTKNEKISFYAQREKPYNYVQKTRFDETMGLILLKSKWSREQFKEKHNWDKQNSKENILIFLNTIPNEKFLKIAKMALSVSEGQEKEKWIRELETNRLPSGDKLKELKEIVADIQLGAYKVVVNHAGTVEGYAVAPLAKAIVINRFRPLFQAASALFVEEETKHSLLFLDYQKEKLDDERRDSKSTSKQFNLFRLMVPFSPGGSSFLALAVEIVGGAFFEFFANHENTSEPLFKAMCKEIYENDEKHHMDICENFYKILHDKETQTWFGKWYENERNKWAMWSIAKQVYGGETKEDHYLIRAVRAFGIEPKEFFEHVNQKLLERFERIGHKIDPSLLPKF